MTRTFSFRQLAEHLENLEDPRGAQGVLHPFISIVTIALLATIGGAQGWEDIEIYGVSHEEWLSSFLNLPFGIPSADTYRRLFERISPQDLEKSFNAWLSSLVINLGAEVIPIDGKTLKGSYDRKGSQSALHCVSAWASEHRLFLGQVKVESKSNEITAIPALLELLDISGSIITIDAMGTQHEIAHRIVTLGADYVLALKANHPTLHTQVKQWLQNAQNSDFDGVEYSYDVRVESGHHRREKRQVISDGALIYLIKKLVSSVVLVRKPDESAWTRAIYSKFLLLQFPFSLTYRIAKFSCAYPGILS